MAIPEKDSPRISQIIPYGRLFPVSKIEGHFLTIQAAIDAAVTAGFGPGVPALVEVYPGSYTEDLTLVSGIDIRAATTYQQSGFCDEHTELLGKVTYATTDVVGTSINFVIIAGLAIRPASGIAVDFSGTQSQLLTFRNVTICGFGAAATDGAVEVANTYASGANPGDRSKIFFDNCIVRSASANDTRALLATSGDVAASRTVFLRGAGSDEIAIESSGGATGLCEFLLENSCQIFGAFSQGPKADPLDAGEHNIRDSSIETDDSACIISGKAGILHLDDLLLNRSTAGVVVAGNVIAEVTTNQIIYTDLAYIRTGKGFATGLRCLQNMQVPANRFVNVVASGTVPSAGNDLIVVDGTAASSGVILPLVAVDSGVSPTPINNALPGTVVEVKESSGLVPGTPLPTSPTSGFILVTTPGGQTIDGVVASGGSFREFKFSRAGQHVQFTANEAGTGWLITENYLPTLPDPQTAFTFLQIDTAAVVSTISTTLITLVVDGDAVFIRAQVTGRTLGTPGTAISAEVGGTFYRDNSLALPFIGVINLINTVSSVGYTTATVAIGASGAAGVIGVDVTADTGLAIQWTIERVEIRRLR
jgi:hypothetical protein